MPDFYDDEPWSKEDVAVEIEILGALLRDLADVRDEDVPLAFAASCCDRLRAKILEL